MHLQSASKLREQDLFAVYTYGLIVKMNEPNKKIDGTYWCCMVAGAGKRNGNRAKTVANQDKKRVPERGGELKTWDFDKTKVRIYVDRTKWKRGICVYHG